MTIRTDNSQGGDKPDALREAYLNAVADDRGPSAQSSAAILAHARQRAESMANPAPEKAAQFVKPSTRPAANDRFWLRHALGGLAAVGLVGWLMLQHAAWWDGTDKGVGADPHQAEVTASAGRPELAEPSSAAETASMAAEARADVGQTASVEHADAAPVAADAVAPVAANATTPSVASQPPRPSAVAAAKVQQERMHAQAQADEASSAMNKDISAQSTAGSRAASTAKMQAESRAPSAEVAAGPAGTVSAASSDKKELLPICPEDGDEVAQRELMDAQARAKRGQKSVEPPWIKDGLPYCRPRRPHPRPRKPDAPELPGAPTGVQVPDAAGVNPLD